MSASQTLVALVLAASVAVVPGVPPATAKEPVVEPCTELAASPDFANDGHAFCAAEVVIDQRATGLVIHATTDGGRSWRRTPGAGLVVLPDRPGWLLRGLFVSPHYARDRTLFLALHVTGIFASLDGGTTFVSVDPLAGYGRLTPLRLGVDAGEQAAFLNAWSSGVDGSNQSALIVPSAGLHVPVKGSPGRDVAYVVSPAYPVDGVALVLADEGVGHGARTLLYACNAGFECSTPRYVVPKGHRIGRMWFTGATTAGLLVVALLDDNGEPTLWRSSDLGRSFVRWNAAQRLLDGYRFPPTYGLAFAGGRIYLRTSAVGAADPPAEQLFVSVDGGRRFRRLSWGRDPQDGARGVMPVNTPMGPIRDADQPRGFVLVPRPRTVLMLGFGPYDGSGRHSFHCTTDDGRTWHRTCHSTA